LNLRSYPRIESAMPEFVPDDLLKDFITESDELVQQVEQDLLAMEDHADAEVLNRIFRGMHTIKGTSSFFGFEKLVELTHHAEDLLNQLRKGEFPVTREIIDALLRQRPGAPDGAGCAQRPDAGVRPDSAAGITGGLGSCR
jgi:chemotaxis protein histidine kinase CheA